MGADEKGNRQVQLERIVNRKIIPALVNITGPVPDGFEAELIRNAKLTNAVKNQYIEESGIAEEGHLIYLESGSARSYYYNTIADRYVVTHIMKKHEVIININAYLYHKYRTENIQMVEDGTLIMIPYSSLRNILNSFPVMYPVILHFQAEREKQQAAYHYLLRLTADERVAIFLDNNPGIAERINKDYIASYLDMTRTTFSGAYAKYRAAKGKI